MKEAVATVVERELEMMYRAAKKMTRNSVDAEDLVSQTMVLAFQHWDSFDGRYPRGWLLRIMRNEWLQTLRKRGRRTEVEMTESLEPTTDDFWKEIDRKLESETIMGALNDLADDFRLVISMCDVEEMSYEDAAAALDIPVGTVKSRLFRGRKMLRSKVFELTNG